MRGRGAPANPPNRFEPLSYSRDPDWTDPEDPAIETQFFKDTSRSIIAYNDSPDVGFDASINPYRGCEHGCVYCFARPTHEYLGFSTGLDFESKILVKEDAPELLRRELSSARWNPQVLAISGVTDPYQPIERRLQLTRRCLQVLAEFRNPVVIITKNHLVTRDVDLLSELARHEAARVFLSITTLDGQLARVMEPRASHPTRRLAAIEALSQAGVQTGVLVAPVIPGLTDHELPSIIAAAAQASARSAGYVTVRLPHGVGSLFEQWLSQHFPDRKDKILHRIRAIRGGKLNDPKFGSRMRGEGIFAEQIEALFALACRKAGIDGRGPPPSTAAFRVPSEAQLPLFE
jgi:DNA repair photolyase